MQRTTTLRILWRDEEERDWIHKFSRNLAARVSDQEQVAEARVTVHIGQAPPAGAKVGRVAMRREIYAIWTHAPCPVCGLSMPVNPNWQKIVDHYPEKVEHRYYGNPTYYCLGSGSELKREEAP